MLVWKPRTFVFLSCFEMLHGICRVFYVFGRGCPWGVWEVRAPPTSLGGVEPWKWGRGSTSSPGHTPAKNRVLWPTSLMGCGDPCSGMLGCWGIMRSK